MGKTAFMFPGQGAQYTGMGRNFYNEYRESAEVYDIASETLKMDIKKLCFEENDMLDKTEYTQIAMFVTEVAILKALYSKGYRSQVNIGLSLGEYASLYASGAINLEDACRIVRQRGIYMENEVPAGKGAMSAVVGMEIESVEKILDNYPGVQIANYNCPGQIVISGITEDVDIAGAELKEAGAKRVIRLNVSGPFHSQLLVKAGEKLGVLLKDVELGSINVPYVANYSADYITDTKDVKELLEKQVYSPVRFQQSVELMIKDGVDTFVEIGPGKTLSGFVKKINKNIGAEINIMNISEPEDLNNLNLQ
ncbi:MAG: ACP S-malonyltransferase [Clostridia bacterium]|nr:ACP S-malonyltransferase [Clostridia bacterium]